MSDYTGSSFISQPVQEEIDVTNTKIATTNANLTQEIYDRGVADNNLQNQINGAATSGALNAEITARTDADTALGVLITDNTNLLGTTRAELTQEITDRQNADINLQNQINPLATQVSLNNEITARTDADTALGVLITDNTNLLGTTRAELTQEVSDRTTADNGLQNQINDRALTISLNNEITARTDGDAALQSQLTYEANSRINADIALQTNITTNATAITNEESARQSADTTLQTNINTNTTAIGTKANLDGGNTFTGEQDINGYAKIDRVIVQAVSNDYPPFRVTNSFSSFTSAQIDADKNALLVRSNTTLAGDSIISAYNNSKNDVVFKVAGDGKTHTKDIEADGDVNLTAGKAYKIDNVSIPTHDDLALKAPIDNASLTGNTTMTRLTVNHSDSASIGLDFNNTNVNQYAGAFNTAGYGWRFYNDNTSQGTNTTFSVNTKGSGAVQTPLHVKNDGKLYTLDQEVDGDVNLSAGHEFKINGVPLSSGGMTPEQEAELSNNTSRLDDLYDSTAVTLRNIDFVASDFNCRINSLEYVEDAMAIGQIPQNRIFELNDDLNLKRSLTNNLFPQLNLNGTIESKTSSGGTINPNDYFCKFDLTGQTAELVVGIDETNVPYQTKIIFIDVEGTANLVIRSSNIMGSQDIILRKRGDCVFLHADWVSSKWKVIGIHTNVQPTLNTAGNITSGNDIICSRNLFSNSAVNTEIDGFTTINLRSLTGVTPNINIDGVEAFMTKATNQTITGVKTFENGIITDEVVTEAAHNLLLKTADTADSVIIDNGSTVGLTQTSTKISLNRALNIPYASVPLGTSTANKSPPAGSLSGDVYRDNANALFIVP